MASVETLTNFRYARNFVFPAARTLGSCGPSHPCGIPVPGFTVLIQNNHAASPLDHSTRRHFSVSPLCQWEKPQSKGLNQLKFREQREAKRLYEFNGRWILPLPDYQKARDIQAAAGVRAGLQKLRRDGMLPPKDFRERPIDITSTFAVHEPYVPPEGDGSKSLLSKEGVKDKKDRAQMWAKSKNAFRKINKNEKDVGGFDASYFADEAVDIYVMAHEALVADDRTRLHELVTAKCYQELTHGLQFKTLRWRFHHNVEPPRAVHGSIFNSGPTGNQFAQVTVRIHSQQSVAIYDRFGRLAYGDPELQRTVIEYVVFEKRISDTYGAWRMHGKLEPDWMDAKPPMKRTFRMPEHEEIKAEDLEKLDARDLADEDEEEKGEGGEDGRKLATA